MARRYLLITLLILTLFNSNAQKSKNKKQNSLPFQEIYTTDNKTHMKQGFYAKLINPSKDTLVKGYYTDNKKTGVWTYYAGKDNAYLKYDFDKDSLLLDGRNSVKKDSVQVRKGSGFVLTKVDRPAVFLGFPNEVKSLIQENFRPPSDIIEKQLTGISMVSLVVNRLGVVQETAIENSMNAEVDAAIRKSMESLMVKWIPATMEGKPVDSKVYLLYNIKTTTDPNLSARANFNDKADLIVINLFYIGIERERVYQYGQGMNKEAYYSRWQEQRNIYEAKRSNQMKY